MHILILDGNHVETEFRQKFGEGHEYSFFDHHTTFRLNFHTHQDYQVAQEAQQEALQKAAKTADIVFSFNEDSMNAWRGIGNATVPIFVETSRFDLTQAHPTAKVKALGIFPEELLFGFCGLPTLLNRTLLEVSLYDEADREKLAAVCAALGTDYRVVADRVGLVTPRVVCMIINEACYTVQEGTATMQDVDLGMKLGTNYPRGPFAWANAIGVERVYAVLEAMWDDTHDERYKVCPLLKRQALRGQPFAV
jgi:3-hydroxybutyryl-CoA dehydrogenase